MSRCDVDNGSWDAGHTYRYHAARFSGEPLRTCESCGRIEAYYMDDLAFEQEMGA